MLIFFVLGFVAGLLGDVGMIILGIAYLGILVPSIGIGVRRLHDVDKSGWMMLIALNLLYLFVTKGTTGPNRFGPDPLGSDTAVFN